MRPGTRCVPTAEAVQGPGQASERGSILSQECTSPSVSSLHVPEPAHAFRDGNDLNTHGQSQPPSAAADLQPSHTNPVPACEEALQQPASLLRPEHLQQELTSMEANPDVSRSWHMVASSGEAPDFASVSVNVGYAPMQVSDAEEHAAIRSGVTSGYDTSAVSPEDHRVLDEPTALRNASSPSPSSASVNS